MVCKACRGRGRMPEPGYPGRDPAFISCPACDGAGEVAQQTVSAGAAEPWDELPDEDKQYLRRFFK